MGYIQSASTVTVVAKLTPFGRQELLSNRNNIITHFSLGDSDANYYVSDILTSGEVPDITGEVGVSNSVNNSSPNNYKIKDRVVVNSIGDLTKLVEPNASKLSSTLKSVGFKILSSPEVNFKYIDRTDLNSSSGNLFNSLGLPITTTQKALFTTIKDINGGFSDTGLTVLNNDEGLVIDISNLEYGEIIDGKTVKIELITSATTYTIYSTFQSSLTPNTTQDVNIRETSIKSGLIGSNIAFLFSDDIKKPNNNPLKSWGTGYNLNKPFSVNKKELFNLTTNTTIQQYADIPVGLIHLEKGLIIINNQTILNNLDLSLSATVSFDSFSTEISQDITCIVDRGEFISSKNPTYSEGDLIRVSEVGLYNSLGNLIAIAKTNKHITIGTNQFMALGIKVTI